MVLQAKGERNFHVFYQLLKGCSEEQRMVHRLKQRPEHYEMLCGGGVLEVNGVDDKSDWERLQKAFTAVGASQDRLIMAYLSIYMIWYKIIIHDAI